MTKSNKAILVVAAMTTVATMMASVPTWYEVKEGGAYYCTSNNDTGAYCMNVNSPEDSYITDTYKPDYVGGHYHDFKASGGRNCTILKKGNTFHTEALCGMSVVNPLEFFEDGTLSAK